MLIALAVCLSLQTHRLAVGDGRPFARIEDAVAAAAAGDEVDVYPKGGGYPQTAVTIDKPGLKIIGAGAQIKLDGKGFEYSGIGRIPRAIFQINKGADGVTIENFELTNAHNRSYNGAGVRINQASNVTVTNCHIDSNDMGIMSNGVDGDPRAGSDQMIDHCEIDHNGNLRDPGFNHNLYLGGTSVTVQFCDIHDSLTGHNIKSRAHFTVVQYCFVHDSANREFDFVEAWDTERPHSNALLMGDVIRKNPTATGNRTVINFGREHGRRDGEIFLINDDIVTPFHSPVVDLTSPNASVSFHNDVVRNPGDAHPEFASGSDGSLVTRVTGAYNVVSPSYDLSGTGIDLKSLYTPADRPPADFAPPRAFYVDGRGNRVEARPLYRYSKSGGWQKTAARFLGAE